MLIENIMSGVNKYYKVKRIKSGLVNVVRIRIDFEFSAMIKQSLSEGAVGMGVGFFLTSNR